MGTAAAPLPLARLAGVGLVVFFANSALLVLQLVAGRLLAPFIGSDLYTWTAIIGVFLAGIALGNAYGGRLADRYPNPRTLAGLLAAGAAAALWVALFPMLLNSTGLHTAIPLGPRIPLLSAVLCLPAGFVLSLLTPVAIKLGLPDVSKAGRVAGLVFALSTLGCLLGNYATGFYLIPAFTINTIVYAAAGVLAVLAAGSLALLGNPSPSPSPAGGGEPEELPPSLEGKGDGGLGFSASAFPDIRQAYLIVFLASFGGMTLELTASRLLAPLVGVSLYSWTGIIGVMLAGTALGNLAGGLIADRVNRPGSGFDPRFVLAGTLVLGGAATVLLLVPYSIASDPERFQNLGLVPQIMLYTFSMFFLPMCVLGMVSPQVIRLSVPDVAHAGRVAGRVYAWSTFGAIVGTFAAGYVLISALGASRVVLAVSLLLTLTSLLAAPVWRANLLLYVFAIALGGITGGIIITWNPVKEGSGVVASAETNYYTIRVTQNRWLLTLTLDHLIHSTVDPEDPLYIYYQHEYVQLEFLWGARQHSPEPKVLVIGGGGYTFPRCAKTLLPETQMDVVEIDPGVTRMAYEKLGLKKELGIRDFNMDGRQFVAERAAPGSYDLIVQDAVNDLSVPWHLLTREYNEAVKRDLKPGGVYLLTVIDSVEYGRLWRSAMRTLRETFPHVELLTFSPPDRSDPIPPDPAADPQEWNRWASTRQVYVIYAADQPLDLAALYQATARQAAPVPAALGAAVGAAATTGPVQVGFRTRLVPAEWLRPTLDRDPGVLLTDQYAPVDNLMAEVFKRRKE